MDMDLKQIRDYVKVLIDETSTTDTDARWTKAQLNLYINMAHRDICKMIMQSPERYFYTYTDFAITEGDTDALRMYDLPTDCREVVLIEGIGTFAKSLTPGGLPI